MLRSICEDIFGTRPRTRFPTRGCNAPFSVAERCAKQVPREKSKENSYGLAQGVGMRMVMLGVGVLPLLPDGLLG